MSKARAPEPRKASKAPAVSVVMPVHNALPHLDAAIKSILAQTFEDFEFVILDDASTDGSRQRLREWGERDRRIRLLTVDENLGTVGSSNMVANAATAPLVARMDADDVSDPDRLRQLLEVFRADPEIGIAASLCDMIDASGRKIRDSELWRLTRRSPFLPFAHGAMMYRRELFEKVGGYREGSEYWEDQDLVLRMAELAKIAVIPRPLFRVRQWKSTRVMCDQQELETAVQKVYRAADQLRQGKDWGAIADQPGNARAKLDPRVFVALGSLHLWSGGNPRLFRRLLTRGELSWNVRSFTALVWTAWASASPSSLRGFLRLLLKSRNLAAAGSISTATPVRWQPLEPSRAIHSGRVRS